VIPSLVFVICLYSFAVQPEKSMIIVDKISTNNTGTLYFMVTCIIVVKASGVKAGEMAALM